MSTNQNLQLLLSSLNAPAAQQTKVASAPAHVPGSSEDSMQQLSDLLQQTKIASANTPYAPDAIEHLEKLAADIESAETLALEKQARLFGTSFADAAMERLTGYEQILTKIAAANLKPMKDTDKPVAPTKGKGKGKGMPPALKADMEKKATADEVRKARDAGAYDGDTLVKIAKADQEWHEKTAAATEILEAAFNSGLASAARVLSPS